MVEVGDIDRRCVGVDYISWLTLDIQYLSIEGRDHAHRVDGRLCSIHFRLGCDYILRAWPLFEAVIRTLCIFQLRLLQGKIILRVDNPIRSEEHTSELQS